MAVVNQLIEFLPTYEFRQCVERYNADDHLSIQLDQAAYALDSTTIDLCLKLFPWAKFRRTKAAVKLHTLLDLRGTIPTMVIVTCMYFYFPRDGSTGLRHLPN